MQPEDLFKNAERLKLSDSTWERIRKDVSAEKKSNLLTFRRPITSLAAVLLIGVIIISWWTASRKAAGLESMEQAAAEELIDPEIIAWYNELGDYSDYDNSELDEWIGSLEEEE
jgi:hypothetical protein